MKRKRDVPRLEGLCLFSLLKRLDNERLNSIAREIKRVKHEIDLLQHVLLGYR